MTNPLHCTFCGKSQHEVRKLIAGPTVFICNECVDLCNGIIGAEVERQAPSAGLFEHIGRALDSRAARRRKERCARTMAQPAPQLDVDAAVRSERERCAQVVESEVKRLERNAAQLLGWSVTQAKVRVLRHMADLIRTPTRPGTELHQ